MKTKIPDDLREIMNLFLNLFQRYSLIMKRAKAFDVGEQLHGREMETVLTIGINPEITHAELTNILGVSKGAVSQLLSRLDDKRMIARFKDKVNPKSINLRLSDKGIKVFDEIMSKRFLALESYLEIFNNAEKKDIDLVKQILNKIEQDLNRILGVV